MLFVGDTIGMLRFPLPVAKPVAWLKADAVNVVVEAAEPDAPPEVEGEEPAPLDFTPLSSEGGPENPGFETPHCGLYWYSPLPSTMSCTP